MALARVRGSASATYFASGSPCPSSQMLKFQIERRSERSRYSPSTRRIVLAGAVVQVGSSG